MKKFFSMMVALATVFAFTACEETPDGPTPGGEGGTLATPVLEIVDQTETGFTVAWEAVENAASYSVVLKGNIQNVTETSVTFEKLNKGDYTLRVKAIGAEGSNWKDSAYAEISVSLTGLTSVDWFTQELYTGIDEEQGNYPYNSLFFTWKGEGVTSIQYGIWETAQLEGATEADIRANLSRFDDEKEVLAEINSAEGATYTFYDLTGGTSYTLYALVTNDEGLEFLAVNECSTEAAEASEAAKKWLGMWNMTSHETITFEQDGTTSFGEYEHKFTINVIAGVSDPNEVIIDGFSLLGEGWPVRGIVNEEGSLNIMNGDVIGMSEDGIYYIWLAYFMIGDSGKGQFMSDPLPTYVFKMDDAGAVTCEMFTAEAEYDDGSKVNITAAHTEVYGLEPNTGAMYFLIENFPAVYIANEIDMVKAEAAPTAKRYVQGVSKRKAAPAGLSNGMSVVYNR